jgi:hypothetical protein
MFHAASIKFSFEHDAKPVPSTSRSLSKESSNPLLGFPSERFREVFPFKFFFPYSILVKCPDHCNFDSTRLTILCILCKSRSSSIHNILKFIIYFSLLKSKYFSEYLVSKYDIYTSCYFLKIKDHVSHPYKTSDIIIVLYL